MTGDMALWQQIIWGLMAVVAFFVFKPGIKAAMTKSEQAENRDWIGLFVPLLVVVLFILLLITLVRS